MRPVTLALDLPRVEFFLRPRLPLLVSICSLRRDNLGACGGPPGLTPILDALASTSMRSDQVWLTSNVTLAVGTTC